jgi:hypothetical protein
VQCERCEANNPDVAEFCYRCGQPLGHAHEGADRGDAYAIQPSEHVAQLALISTLLPHTNRRVANEYRWALILGSAVSVLLAVVGLIAPAVMIAAFLIPVTYLVFAHDVDLWEERPGGALAAIFLLSGTGAAAVSLAFFRWFGEDGFAGLLFAGADTDRGGIASLPVVAIVLFAITMPVIAEIVREIGPVLLVRQPRFDDMIDGFTFGMASGAAYAAFETVIAFGVLFTVGVHSTDALTTWIVLLVNVMIVKPVIYGCASGVAVATFSGRGEGYDGFTGRYVGQFLLAIVTSVAYWLGVRLLAPAPYGAALGLLWGALLAAVLIVRTRVVLHAAVLEAAVEDAARGHRSKWATTDGGHCAECEHALLADSLFCIVCGSSTRAASINSRRDAQAPIAAEAGGAG